jgi:hypothetical protein
MDVIRNKVAESDLIQLDLEQLIKLPDVVSLDMASFLEGGLFLKEKEFRSAIRQLDTQAYDQKVVALHCSTDAILPLWSWMLVSIHLQDATNEVQRGTTEEVRERLYHQRIHDLPIETYKDAKVIVKGCSSGVPISAYMALSQRLRPVVKSLMFGEACSSVPLFKRSRA